MEEQGTRIWLIRHALVEESARLRLYGSTDVALCPDTLVAQAPMYRALARRLPPEAEWVVSPLSRTRRTAQAIQAAGHGERPLRVEPDLIEQSMGDWHGLEHAALPPLLRTPAPPFWPLDADERPPNGESITDVVSRVGRALDRMCEGGGARDVVAVSHGGAIRAALACALRVEARAVLHFSVQNLSLTLLERLPQGWRIGCVNELPDL